MREIKITDHYLNIAKKIESPNFDSRTDERGISLIVIHNISLPPGKFGGGYIEKFFSNQLPVDEHEFFKEIKDLKVSAHLLIHRNGDITQFVPFHKRAWHAGVSQFQEREACNDFSIGIELEGTDVQDFEPEQYCVLVDVLKALMLNYPKLSKENIVGHSDIAPGRKTDPGPHFDWKRLHKELEA